MNQRTEAEMSNRTAVGRATEAASAERVKLALSAGQARMGPDGKVRWLLLVIVAVIALVAGWRPQAPATAAFPGANGKIAFSSNRDGNFEIYVMNPDGSGQTNLTNHPASDVLPNWSPDGTKIAFSSNRDGNFEIYVMNANGSGQTNLTNHPSNDLEPTWSPDGTKIAFTSYRDGNGEVYVMNADGSSQTNLTNHPSPDLEPAWSPDGTKIAFTTGRDGNGNGEVYAMNPDGSGLTNLTNNSAGDDEPAWSPDGTKIAFQSFRDNNNGAEIYVMNADGSGQIRLTNNPAIDESAAWSPDGTKIAFMSNRDSFVNLEIYVMNADGSGQTNLTNHPTNDLYPDWQPLVGNTDTTPPVVSCTVKPNILRPADHRLKTVKARVTVTDEGSGPAGFILFAVSSSEPDAGLGGGDRPNDIQGFALGTADISGQLRAERADDGPGRVYALTYHGMDEAGNIAECATTVTVPLRQ